MVSPLVSILVPAYNVEKYVSQCLESIVNQTYRNLQIVVVDDGSTDATGKICDKYAEEDSRVEVFHVSNGGVANARNILLSKIKGEYFLFIDSDDWIEQDTIEVLLNEMLNRNVDLIGYDCVNSDASSKIDSSHTIEMVYDKDGFIHEYLKHNKINGALWNKLFKTSLVRKNRFREDISYGEDALFCWQLIKNINSVLITNIPKYNHRIHDESLSHRSWTPEGKGSGKIVWDTIREDVIKQYPGYTGLVNSRTALMYMWDLLFASRSNYPRDIHIKERQKFINTHLIDFTRYQLAGFKQYIATVVLGIWYGAGKVASKFM